MKSSLREIVLRFDVDEDLERDWLWLNHRTRPSIGSMNNKDRHAQFVSFVHLMMLTSPKWSLKPEGEEWRGTVVFTANGEEGDDKEW